MTLIWKSLRVLVVLAGYGALGYVVWKKVQPDASLPASPQPAPTPAARLPDACIDLSLPLAAGDIDRAD